MRLTVLLIILLIIPSKTVIAQSSIPIHTTRLQIPVEGATIKLEKQANTETKKILFSDNLSSTKVIINEVGELSDNPTYYPYGSSIQQIKTSDAARQYTGQRKVSDDSSIYNYNARYYNPTTAIFVQPDSVEGPTRYAYVAGNPVMNNDPSGKVVSYAKNLFHSDYEKNPEPCLKNLTSCLGAHLNYETGILSSFAFLTPDRSSDWLDKEVKDQKKYVSQKYDLTSQAYAATGVGVAGVFGSNGKIALSIRNFLMPEPNIARKPLSTLGQLSESMSGGNGSVHVASETSVAKIFFEESHPVELKYEIAMLQEYGGGLLPNIHAGITDDAGKLIGIEMERIHGRDMVRYYKQPAIPQVVVDRAVDQLKALKERGFWHGDIAERNIMIEVGQDGIPNNLRLIDPSRTSDTYGSRTNEVERFRSIIEFSNAIWRGEVPSPLNF